MKLLIQGWTCEGLRCPDAEIDLRQGEEDAYKVSLLQMPSGTGKTTTLNLMRAALDGTAVSWGAKEVESYRRPGAHEESGRFVLRLLADGELLTFTLKLAFDSGRVEYTTQYGSRNAPFHDPPASVRRFLTPDFVRLFIFDGEYAGSLFEPKKAEAQNAISKLFQLHLLEDIRYASEDYMDRQLKASGAKKKSLDAVKKLQIERDRAREELAKREKMKKEAEGSLKKMTARLAELRAQEAGLEDQNNKLQDKLKLAEREFEESTKNGEGALARLLAELRKPLVVNQRFEQDLRSLVDGLEKLRLPADIGSEFLKELADDANEDCVCGRPLGSSERRQILELAGRYLGSDVHAVLATIKHESNSELDALAAGSASGLRGVVKAARDADSRRRQSASKLDHARKVISTNGTDAEREIYKEIIGLDKEIEAYRRLVDRTMQSDGPYSISAAKEALKVVEEELAVVTETASLNEKVKLLGGILRDAYKKADVQLRVAVRDATNERLAKVLKNDPIRISDIGRAIELEWQMGASVGQTLGVGYTFLMTLLLDGNHSFPLVVDSPAGPLDHSIRTEVGRLIPEMSEQFVAFTISTEREAFVPALVERSGASVQFLTLFRLTDGTRPFLATAPEACTVLTSNSALIEDRAYFEGFNAEEEDSVMDGGQLGGIQ